MNNLMKTRGFHGLSQAELAKQLGLTRASISIAEKNGISPKVAVKVAELLGESAVEIMGTDNFKILPKTEKEKEYLINLIKEM